jgi:hypothetical protein
MTKLLLFYLTNNDRFFVFEKFMNELQKCQYKDNIDLLIVSSESNFDQYQQYLQHKYNNVSYAYIPCPKSDYLPKVRYAIEYAKKNHYKYIMKCDNDIIIPVYTFNYLYESLPLLDSNLTLSPTLSTGIPSVEYFIEQLFTKEEQYAIREQFNKCEFFEQGGIFDYRFLNQYTIHNNESWNYHNYFDNQRNIMNSYPILDSTTGRTINGYHPAYRGIHPIRHGWGNDLINDYIVQHRNDFFKEKECSIIYDDSPYLCNMCFIISTENYDKLLNIEQLTIDGCDEVPLNRYAWKYNLKHLIVNNGLAIHIAYNWRWFLNKVDGYSNIDKPIISLLEYENNFINALYS